jgi:hypothetical protein
LHDRLEHLTHALAGFAAGEQGAAAIQAHDFFDLRGGAVHVRRRQVDLVQDRNHLEIVFDRQIGVGHRLRLDALGRIDHEQCAFAGA